MRIDPKDRFMTGIIAGFGAGMVKDLLDLVLYAAHFHTHPYFNYASVMIFGILPHTFIEKAFAFFGTVVFDTFLGVLYSYLTLVVVSRYYRFRGWFYSLSCWFVIYSLTTLYKVPQVFEVKWVTPISHFITASVYGLLLGIWLNRLQPEQPAPM